MVKRTNENTFLTDIHAPWKPTDVPNGRRVGKRSKVSSYNGIIITGISSDHGSDKAEWLTGDSYVTSALGRKERRKRF